MTRQQTYAKGAYELVTAIKDRDAALVREYRTQCMKLPVLLKQSGLVQTLAFLWSRDKDGKGNKDSAARRLCHDVAQIAGLPGKDQGEALLRKAQGADELSAYLLLSRNVSDISVWLRRFAQSELTAPKEGD